MSSPRTIVVDTSGLVTLSIADVLPLVLEEYDVHTTATVLEELEATAAYEDTHATAARTALSHVEHLTVHEGYGGTVHSSRVDAGEGSCAMLARDLEAAVLITDDLRAMPELKTLTTGEVTISAMLLAALVRRGVLERDDARARLDRIADGRDWLEAPISRRMRRLFDE